MHPGQICDALSRSGLELAHWSPAKPAGNDGAAGATGNGTAVDESWAAVEPPALAD